MNITKCSSATLVILALQISAIIPAASSAEPTEPKAEGTWKWTFTMPDGTKSSPRAKLKRDGNVLTGTSLVSAGTEVPIAEGKVDGRRVSWSVVREHGGRKVTTRYSGELSGETLVGKIESDWSGTAQTYPWEAKRASDSPAGIWKWEFTFGRGGTAGGNAGAAGTGGGAGAGTGGVGGTGAAPGGRSGGRGGTRFESRMTLKYDDGKLTGKVKGRTSDTEISNATFEKGKIAFEVERERGGVTSITKYWGTLDGDTIRGKSQFEFGEETRTVDWEANRVEE